MSLSIPDTLNEARMQRALMDEQEAKEQNINYYTSCKEGISDMIWELDLPSNDTFHELLLNVIRGDSKLAEWLKGQAEELTCWKK